MSNKVDISRFVSIFYCISSAVSCLFNSLLIFIIATKSPKHVGTYKYLMIIISIFEILYSILDILLLPVHFSKSSAIVLLSTANYDILGRPFVSVLDLVFWGFFGASLALFAVNFVYRYFAISKHKLLVTFNSWKLVLWLLIPFVNGVIWSLNGLLLCGPNREISDFVRKEVSLRFGKDIDKTIYHAIYLYKFAAGGKIILRYDSVFSTAVMLISVIISFCIIIYFGVKCHHRITSVLQSSTSSYHQTLQKQLFYALVIQTLIPIVLMNFPVGVMFSAAFLNIDLGPYSTFVTTSITLYPAIDPFPNFFIIKPYREALSGYCRCRKQVQPYPGQISGEQMNQTSA